MLKLTRRKVLAGTLALGTASLLTACGTGVKVTLPEGEFYVDTTNEDIQANIESSYVLDDGTYRADRLGTIDNIATELLNSVIIDGSTQALEGYKTLLHRGVSSYAEFNAEGVLNSVLTSSATTNKGTALKYAEQGLNNAVKSVLVPAVYVRGDDGAYKVFTVDAFGTFGEYLMRSDTAPVMGVEFTSG